MTIEKRARQANKKKVKSKSWIYLSTAAVIVICGIFIYTIIIGNETSHNANQPNVEEDPINQPVSDDETKDKEEIEAPNESEGELSITKGDTREGTIIIEGMEEPELFTTFIIEPYGIQFEIADYLANYEVSGDQVRFFSDPEYASITMSISENTNIESVLPSVKEQYNANEPVQGTEDLPSDENEYYGVYQSFYDPPEGYYLYEIEGNVLAIQYQYGIEGGDGTEPRLEALRKSIQY